MHFSELKSRLTGKISQGIGDLGRVDVYNHGNFSNGFMTAARNKTVEDVRVVCSLLPVKRVVYRVDLYLPESTAWDLREGKVHTQGSFDYVKRCVGVLLFSRGEGFDEVHQEELRASLAHEANHAARYDIKVPVVLSEVIICEGLAIHFENQVVEKSGLPYKYDGVLTEENSQAVLELARKERNSREGIDVRWFKWGDSTDRIPGSAGHVLGYQVVERFLQKNPGLKPSDIYAVPSEILFDL